MQKTLASTRTLMKKTFLSLVALTLCASANFAQAAPDGVAFVVVTNPGNTTPPLAANYTTLAAAITDLNATTAISGPVIITLNINETAPAGGYSITAIPTGASATNNIIIQGLNSAITITAPTPQTSGNLNDAIFKLIGADWITIQSFTMLENAANTTTAAGTNNMTEWGVALLYVSTTNGAQNNTIQNNTITLIEPIRIRSAFTVTRPTARRPLPRPQLPRELPAETAA